MAPKWKLIFSDFKKNIPGETSLTFPSGSFLSGYNICHALRGSGSCCCWRLRISCILLGAGYGILHGVLENSLELVNLFLSFHPDTEAFGLSLAVSEILVGGPDTCLGVSWTLIIEFLRCLWQLITNIVIIKRGYVDKCTNGTNIHLLSKRSRK